MLREMNALVGQKCTQKVRLDQGGGVLLRIGKVKSAADR